MWTDVRSGGILVDLDGRRIRDLRAITMNPIVAGPHVTPVGVWPGQGRGMRPHGGQYIAPCLHAMPVSIGARHAVLTPPGARAACDRPYTMIVGQ